MSHSAVCRLPVQGQHSQKLAEPELRTPSSRAGWMHLPWEASAPLSRVQLFPAFFLPPVLFPGVCFSADIQSPKASPQDSSQAAHDMTPHSIHQDCGVLPSSNTMRLTSLGPAFSVWPSWAALMGRLPHGDLGASCKLPF